MIKKKITLIRIGRPPKNDLNQELQWLGSSLGLFSLRDKDRSCFRLFIELLKTSKSGLALSSDDLAFRLGLSRGTVIHHMHKLLDSGIIVPIRGKYLLRVNSLRSLIDELKRDLENTFVELETVAKEIDDAMGL